MHVHQWIRRAGLAACGLLVAGTAPASGQQTPQADGNSAAQVAIDPASGRLRAPTEQEQAELAAAQRQLDAQRLAPQARSASRLSAARPATEAQALHTVQRYPAGKIGGSALVPESLVSQLVAERQADGRIAVHHQGEAPAAQPGQAPEAVR